MADLYYYEQGYIDDGYHVYIANAVIEISPYIEDGYIEAGYYDDYSAQSGLVCDAEIVSGELVDATGSWTTEFAVTATVENIKQFASSQSSEFAQTTAAGRILETGAEFTGAFTPTLTADAFKNHTAILDTVSTLSVDAVANRSANVLLEHIADLNAMAAKTAVSSATMAASASQSTQAQQTSSAQSQLTSSTSVYFNGGRRNIANAVFNSQFAIPRLTVFKSYERPLMLKQSVGTITIDTSEKKFGAGSLFWNGTNRYLEYYYSRTVPTPIRGQIVDFWIKPIGGSSFSNILTFNDGTRDYIRFSTGSDGRIVLQFFANNFTRTINSNQSLDATWTHVAMAWDTDSARTSLYINGQRQNTVTFIPQPSSTKELLRIGNNTSISSTINIDEVRYLAGGEGFAAAQGFDPNSTTCTVPSAQAINTDNTNALFHFNTDFSDDVSGIRTFEAQLSATASLTAQANANIKVATAAVTATATVSAVIGRQQPAEAQLEAAQTLAVTVSKFVGVSSDANTSTAVTAVIGSVKEYEISAGALFDPTITIQAQLAGVALLESQAVISIDAVKSTDVIASLTTESAQSTTVTITAGLSSSMSADTTVTVTVTRIQAASADLTAEFTLVEITDKIAGLAVLANSEFTQTTTADKLKIVTATLTSESQVTVTAVKTTDINSTQNLEFAQNTDNIRIRFADSQQSADTEIVTDAVKTVSVISDQSALTTQTTTAVKSVDSVISVSSLFTPTLTAQAQIAGVAYLTANSTLTVITGFVVEYEPVELISTGLDTSTGSYQIENVPPQSYGPSMTSGYVMAFWAKRDTVTTGNYAYSMLAPTSFADSSQQYQILQFKNGTGPTGGGITRSYDHSITLFTPWNQQSNPYWDNTVPQDTEWHHYLIRYLTVPSGLGFIEQYTLYVDGQSQGTSNGSNGLRVNSGGGVYFGTNFTSPNPTTNLVAAGNFDGAMAQVWLGVPTDSFNISQFYDLAIDGAKDLTGFATPEQYNLLSDPWTGVTASTLTASDQPLENGRISSDFEIIADFDGVFLFAVEMFTTASLTVTAQAQRLVTVSLTDEFTATTQADTRIGVISEQISEFTVEFTAIKIIPLSSSLSVESTVLAAPGFIKLFDSTANSEFTVDASVDVKPPIRTEADLLATASLTANVASFTDSITLMVTFGELTADVTLIPPIRIEADLQSEFTVTAIIGSVEQFASLVASSGTMEINPVKTTGIVQDLTVSATVSADTFKFTGIVAEFTALYSQLTAGDIINIDPYLQLQIDQETRALVILAENRVITIESETRVNTIKE